MSVKLDEPVLTFENQQEWEAWLDANHASQTGIWIKLARAGSGIPSVTRDEALDVALCYGWIDGQGRSFDEHYWLQRFTPRRARSKWSRINTEKVEVLIAAGRMRPAGMREVERAKADGRWEAAYEPPRTATVPDDLQQALEANPTALEAFQGLNSTNRYAILHRIHDAKRPETRARRIAQFVEMLSEGRKPYP